MDREDEVSEEKLLIDMIEEYVQRQASVTWGRMLEAINTAQKSGWGKGYSDSDTSAMSGAVFRALSEYEDAFLAYHRAVERGKLLSDFSHLRTYLQEQTK